MTPRVPPVSNGPLERRHPACGSELEHGPHEYTDDHWPDGTVMRARPQAGWCAGWTGTEADLCVMLREVHRTLLEKAPPDGTRTFRVEAHPGVIHALLSMFTAVDRQARLDNLFGAELVPNPVLPVGRWAVCEVLPPVIEGTVR